MTDDDNDVFMPLWYSPGGSTLQGGLYQSTSGLIYQPDGRIKQSDFTNAVRTHLWNGEQSTCELRQLRSWWGWWDRGRQISNWTGVSGVENPCDDGNKLVRLFIVWGSRAGRDRWHEMINGVMGLKLGPWVQISEEEVEEPYKSYE